MITETGKAILSKYLIGQSPGYASHIALGCGPRPLAAGEAFGDYSNKESLDFEMFRVPIISRGYVTENNQTSIALTAELPTEERYEITEVGIYSAGANPSAGSRDSKTVFSFSRNEGWEYHAEGVAQSLPVRNLPLNSLSPTDIDFPTLTEQYRYHVLADGLTANSFRVSESLFKIVIAPPAPPASVISDIVVSTTGPQSGTHTVLNSDGEPIGAVTMSDSGSNLISLNGHGLSAQDSVYFVSSGSLPPSILSARPVVPALQTASSNVIFVQEARVKRNERSRFLDNVILLGGDTGNIVVNPDTGNLEEGPLSRHIHLTGQSFSFDKNSSTDELRIAFSVVNRLEASDNPEAVRILVEFRSTESVGEGSQFAKFEAEVFFVEPPAGVSQNRYIVLSKKLEDLEKSANFTWSAMNVAKISVSVLDTVLAPPPGDPQGAPTLQQLQSDKWYVALDALRFENTSIKNPLYGLTGYSVVRTETADGLPIIKGSNTKSLVEFRFALSVGN
jgi:hypothetical protein